MKNEKKTYMVEMQNRESKGLSYQSVKASSKGEAKSEAEKTFYPLKALRAWEA